MTRKRMTIDHLAVIVADGFQALQNELGGRFLAVDTRFLAVDTHFLAVESELKDLKSQVGRIERKLDSTIERLDDHSGRLKRLEESIQG